MEHLPRKSQQLQSERHPHRMGESLDEGSE